MLPSYERRKESGYVDAVDDGNAVHATVEHELEDLEEGVVGNSEGELPAVRIHKVWWEEEIMKYLDTDGCRSLVRAETDRDEEGRMTSSERPCTGSTTT